MPLWDTLGQPALGPNNNMVGRRQEPWFGSQLPYFQLLAPGLGYVIWTLWATVSSVKKKKNGDHYSDHLRVLLWINNIHSA